MSVVACRIYDDRIEIASDSITVRGHTQTKGETSKLAKLVQINSMTIGAVGTCEETALLFQFCGTHKPAGNTERDILAFFVEFAEWKKKQTESWSLSNSFICIYGSRAFSIEGFLVEEIAQYDAIGAGEAYALTALYLGHDVQESINVACEVCIYCEKPILYFVVPK